MKYCVKTESVKTLFFKINYIVGDVYMLPRYVKYRLCTRIWLFKYRRTTDKTRVDTTWLVNVKD